MQRPVQPWSHPSGRLLAPGLVQQGTDLAINFFTCPENAGTHRTHRTAHDDGYVLVTEAVEFAQHQGGAQFVRQTGDGLVHGRFQLAGQRLAFRRIAVVQAELVGLLLRFQAVDVDIDSLEAEQQADEFGLHHSDTPEGEALAGELEAAVHKAIASLPDELRTALMLREFDGLSYEDIAIIMRCPVGTVRSRIFRAREEVDRQIGPLLD